MERTADQGGGPPDLLRPPDGDKGGRSSSPSSSPLSPSPSSTPSSSSPLSPSPSSSPPKDPPGSGPPPGASPPSRLQASGESSLSGTPGLGRGGPPEFGVPPPPSPGTVQGISVHPPSSAPSHQRSSKKTFLFWLTLSIVEWYAYKWCQGRGKGKGEREREYGSDSSLSPLNRFLCCFSRGGGQGQVEKSLKISPFSQTGGRMGQTHKPRIGRVLNPIESAERNNETKSTSEKDL